MSHASTTSTFSYAPRHVTNELTPTEMCSMDVRVCPYDPGHTLHPTRFIRHILKCRKNHPNTQLKACHYNASHLHKPDEIQQHELECPDNRDHVWFGSTAQSCLSRRIASSSVPSTYLNLTRNNVQVSDICSDDGSTVVSEW